MTQVTVTGIDANGTFGEYSMDNLVVNSVPEPGTYALMLAGLRLVGFIAPTPQVLTASTFL